MFINWMFVRKHSIPTHKLSKPFNIRTADGSHSKSGKITNYCILGIRIDRCTMFGKFNVTLLSEKDDILLGCPWLSLTEPTIDWAKGIITMNPTPRSLRLETTINRLRKKNGIPPFRFYGKKPSVEDGPPETDSPVNPLSSDSDSCIEEIDSNTSSVEIKKMKMKQKMKKKKKIPALTQDPDIDESEDFDTPQDIWMGENQFVLPVTNISTFKLSEDEVLIEYSSDGSSVRLIENICFDSPLTRDGTSATEIRRTARSTPLQNNWILSTSKEEPRKLSNKAQEFAVAGEQEKKKKTFEELIPSYLHDYADIFADDGLNQLPPSRPGVDHQIDTKPGFIPKTSRAYPLSPRESEAVKAFLNEHLKKDFIEPSKSPQSSGFFFVGKKDGSMRPCQDYRYINEWTVKNAYPLLLIPPLINKL
jgi:hypothetical protein